MTRLKLTAAVLAAAMLAMAGMALASPQFKQSAKVTLTATKPNVSSGVKATIASSDPGAPNAQPKGLKVLTLTFPVNTRFNFKSKALKQCKATDTEIQATGGAVCPSKSKLGTGTALANGAPVIPKIPESVAAFAGNNQVLLMLSPQGGAGSRLVLHGKVSANRMTTEVPVQTLGPVNIVITELRLSIKTIGKGSTAFIRAGKCVKKKFVVKSSFLYQTGAKLTISSSSSCK